MNRKPYPTDVSDDEWALVAPYLTLMREDAPQREYDLREVFNALRWILRAGAPWRMLPHDFPRWEVVYQQAQRWIKWGCFEAIVHDLRVILREAEGKKAQPSAVVFDGRTVQSSVESGERAGFDGNKRRKGSKVHFAVDTLGYLLSLVVTPANESSNPCQRARTRTSRAVMSGGSRSDRSECSGCFCGSRLHGGESPRSRPGKGNVFTGSQASRSEEGVRCASQALQKIQGFSWGCRTLDCLDSAFSSSCS